MILQFLRMPSIAAGLTTGINLCLVKTLVQFPSIHAVHYGFNDLLHQKRPIIKCPEDVTTGGCQSPCGRQDIVGRPKLDCTRCGVREVEQWANRTSYGGTVISELLSICFLRLVAH